MLLPPVSRRSRPDWRILVAYLAGTLCGAFVTAAAAWIMGGLISPLPESIRGALFALGALMVWLCWRGPLSRHWPLPENKRQIPTAVFLNGLVPGAARFGFELGTGVRTYVPSPAPYLVLLVLLCGNLPFEHAVLIAAGFGLARGAPLVVQFTAAHRRELSNAFLGGHEEFAPHTAGILVLIGGSLLV